MSDPNKPHAFVPRGFSDVEIADCIYCNYPKSHQIHNISAAMDAAAGPREPDVSGFRFEGNQSEYAHDEPDVSEHTPEPWTLEPGLMFVGQTGSDQSAPGFWSTQVPDEGPFPFGSREADARRIVACVNACAGIPTAALEGASVKALVEALGEYLDWHETNFALPSGNFEDPDQTTLAKDARAALAPFLKGDSGAALEASDE